MAMKRIKSDKIILSDRVFDGYVYFENGRIAEHWDVMETIAGKDTWQNQNGKF